MRRLPRPPPVDRRGVVLDAVAEPHLPQVLEVELGAHPESLRFQQLALLLEPGQPLLQLVLDAPDRPIHPLARGRVVGGREQDEVLQRPDAVAGERVELPDRLDVVAEHLDAHRRLVVGGVHLDDVAFHPELAPHQRHLVALVLHGDHSPQERPLVVGFADAHHHHVVGVLGG